MKKYSVKEVAVILGCSERKVYQLIEKVTILTGYQFQRVFRGHFYRDKPRKELVITNVELEAFSKIECLQLLGKITQKDAILHVFDTS